MGTASPERSARIERELRLALDREEFILHVQPIVDLTTGAVVAAETLVRWQHPRDGLLPPAAWLDVAESTDIIHGLGEWVLDQSCRLAASWAEELGPHAPVVHVNISARQLDSGLLPSQVIACLDRYALPGDRLVLELTETHLDPLPVELRQDLERLAERGVRLAADDFGTGYSPLTRLTDLPIEMLKIDRQFVEAM
ncbi:MAG TPA: EAL domain-containing protein, partial [Actinomycetales bacterium]|nr:EAL domain-containing protein [Actinomycetales bacterium]